MGNHGDHLKIQFVTEKKLGKLGAQVDCIYSYATKNVTMGVLFLCRTVLFLKLTMLNLLKKMDRVLGLELLAMLEQLIQVNESFLRHILDNYKVC